ncbi:DUF2971 domain-containing protein [Bacillus thuringiensis]|uniref:DUF2971 domain-containing protein n=1 Tax=Bacillus thuringiensis TaxID=1428 RepID=UPI002224904F|nr:DUF2971 domain-containing protein [Bacillus thuringiensis]UYX53363.1 DUF2971 domain-containing protein [Bacillus thuringiensis]
MLNNEFDSNQYLYHFTKYTTALEYILPKRLIRFSTLKNTNDLRERKEWAFSMGIPNEDIIPFERFQEINKDINSLVKENSKVICFTRDNSIPVEFPYEVFGRGYSHPRMWAQYGGNHRGVCLMFNKQKLGQEINKQLSQRGMIYKGNVNYGTTYSRKMLEAFHFRYEDIVREGLMDFAQKHSSKYIKELFFEKALDWKEEWEYRWVLLDKEKSDYQYVNYKNSLEEIILGEDFPPVYESIILAYCKKFNTKASRLLWKNGIPNLFPVYSPYTEEEWARKVF